MRKSPKLQLSRWFSEINPYCYISLLPWITLASIDDVLASLVFVCLLYVELIRSRLS
ncbi:hypothetical protein HanPI659440_Chr09g0321261 [Helianthus annuus]|nr:hypothetical protein HanPI659440_Chr09g0321261 [Helianthus annuus]